MTENTLSQENNKWLCDKLDTAKELGVLTQFLDIPRFITENINPNFELREYQKEAFARFFYYFNQYPNKEYPIHLLYNMATGSGKTLIMAGLILYLYEKGYRNFLFFVNSKTIIEKTKDNFLNNLSIKYLFNQKIVVNNKEIKISKIDNFEGVNNDDINICFTTIQKLHSDLDIEKENSLTFDDFKSKEIVLLADEAHHGQKKTISQEALFRPTWENTVEEIFKQNKKNILLEFTATMDFINTAIEKKYKSKLIYRYDLKQFRNDKFSKDVEILRSDTDEKGRILLALILNQYRQDTASKYGIQLKPIILFKAQKTIAQSEKNKEFFHNIIDNLSKQDIDAVRNKTDIKEIKKAFDFFDNEGITTDLLIQKLKLNFDRNKCISMNNEKTLEENQILVNTLEESSNQIRAIFTVDKLNEGWDVLNLFDIVRLYDTRDDRYNKPGKTTISEAQLIGRGARYFPFKLKSLDNDKYKRKFDNDLENELRIIERLHFHSFNESSYISQLKKALIKEGLIDDKTVEKELKLKENFKKSSFFKNGRIFLNKRIVNDYSHVGSFADLGVKDKDFQYEIRTLKGKVTKALTDENYDNLYIVRESSTLQLDRIEKHIFKNAISKKEFFKFENLKKIFPNLNSIDDLIENKEFLADIKINFTGSVEDLQNLSNRHKLEAVIKVLDEIENKLKNNMVYYKGTKKFFSNNISEVFYDKLLKIEASNERVNGQESFIQNNDWYAFNANYGTSEEKACVKLIDRLIKENFKNKYKEIFLLRNELHFVIYNFKDGRAFAPDFVLFMKDMNKKEITYQIFIEPKGKQIEKMDEWKEKFLIEIKEMFESEDLIEFIETKKYHIIGVPFYNKEDENKFKNELLKSI